MPAMNPYPPPTPAKRVARLALWLTLAACLGRLGGYAWARVQAALAARVEEWIAGVKADLSRLAAEVAAGTVPPDLPAATERQRPAEPKRRSDRLPENLGRKPATPPPRPRRQNPPPDAPEATAPARPRSQPPPRPDRPPLPAWRRERRPGAPASRAIPRPSESQKRS